MANTKSRGKAQEDRLQIENARLRAENLRLRRQLVEAGIGAEPGAPQRERSAAPSPRALPINVEDGARAEFLDGVLEGSGDCIKVLDLDGRLRFMSAGGRAVMEVDDFGALAGCSWPDMWTGEANAAVRAAIDTALAGGTGRFQGHAPTARGTPKDWDVVVTPLHGSDGRPDSLLAISRDVTEPKRVADALARTEERLRLAVAAAGIGIWDLDLATGRLDWDSRFKALFGFEPDDDPTFDDFVAGLHPGDRARVVAALHAALDPATADDYDMEYRAIGRDDGVERWLAAKGRVVPEGAGPGRFIGAIRDITARRRAEVEKQWLADELHHRVKNTLAIVQAIVLQTLRGVASPAEARDAIEGRLTALGRSHDVLVQRDWTGAGLREIADGALQPFDNGAPGRIRLDGPDVSLPVNGATGLTLILHELATNSVKYGALSVEGGGVTLGWRIEEGGGGPVLQLGWQERGGPPVKDPARRGFGSRLIERGLAGVPESRTRLAYEPDGVLCEVSLPLAAIQG